MSLPVHEILNFLSLLTARCAENGALDLSFEMLGNQIRLVWRFKEISLGLMLYSV